MLKKFERDRANTSMVVIKDMSELVKIPLEGLESSPRKRLNIAKMSRLLLNCSDSTAFHDRFQFKLLCAPKPSSSEGFLSFIRDSDFRSLARAAGKED